MEHELIPVYTKFNGNGVRVQNDSNMDNRVHIVKH